MAWLGFPQVTRVLYFVMQFSHKIFVALSSKIKTRKKEIPVFFFPRKKVAQLNCFSSTLKLLLSLANKNWKIGWFSQVLCGCIGGIAEKCRINCTPIHVFIFTNIFLTKLDHMACIANGKLHLFCLICIL